ncbi:hypothetical protein [Streptomyces sp. NRRL S-340]|uniref:hypothetical protein n=1 Tax=Streptomyces sp. NRRL S-340 TaxID=1463901 RepID=UPI0007C4334B|nr:hypothetical protein [Streptomyces sp. NRRL S-340]
MTQPPTSPNPGTVSWSDAVQDAMEGDLVTALAYGTPAGGCVIIPVSPTGLVDRAAGTIGVTTSLAFNGKLFNILRDSRVAMAYHTREHGFATAGEFAVVQGRADVPLSPSPEVLADLAPRVERFLGAVPTGKFWDWILRDYFDNRIVIDIAVQRVVSWPDESGNGERTVSGAAWPGTPDTQPPPAKGTGPRVGMRKLHGQVTKLTHQLIGYRGADGYPVVVPVRVTGHSERGLLLECAPGLLPEGARRAGFTAHAFGPQAVGLANRICTGWLEVDGDTVVYAPHTTSGFAAPPVKTVQMFFNGVFAKQGWRKAQREGTLAKLAQLKDAHRV